MDSERPEPDPIASASFAEDRRPDGAPRPGYDATLTVLADADLDVLCATIQERLSDRGVGFGGQSFTVDAVPRMLPGAEWDALAAGLQQRARALNAFLHDAYGELRVVAAGIVDGELISGAEGYEPDLAGRLPAHCAPAAVIGFDIVRDSDGSFLVLEDNLRTPSGIAYALAARDALVHALPPGLPVPRPIDPVVFELLAGVMRAAGPAGEPTRAVVLTDGPDNVAHYEHALIARRLGLPLITPNDLVRDGAWLGVRTDSGVEPVNVVYRRTDEDRVRDEDGALTGVAELLVEPWLSGRVGVVNAFGAGVADDKRVHGHAEEFVRFYLGEEPLVRSVPTLPLATAAERATALGRLHELVVKPRHGHGGVGVVIGAHADAVDLERAAAELAANPDEFVVQPIVPLSCHPTVIDGRLEARHVDLRAFAFCGETVGLMPGGLTRVALDAGALVVNSSQNGGGKDTWVLD